MLHSNDDIHLAIAIQITGQDIVTAIKIDRALDDVSRPGVGGRISAMSSGVFIPRNPIQSVGGGGDYIKATVVVDVYELYVLPPVVVTDSVFRPNRILIPKHLPGVTAETGSDVRVTVTINVSQCFPPRRRIDIGAFDLNPRKRCEY